MALSIAAQQCLPACGAGRRIRRLVLVPAHRGGRCYLAVGMSEEPFAHILGHFALEAEGIRHESVPRQDLQRLC